MISNGMFEYWYRNEFQKIKNLKSRKNKKKNDQSDSSWNKDDLIKPLTNFQLQSAYYFFLIGMVVSILLVLIEISLFIITL